MVDPTTIILLLLIVGFGGISIKIGNINIGNRDGRKEDDN